MRWIDHKIRAAARRRGRRAPVLRSSPVLHATSVHASLFVARRAPVRPISTRKISPRPATAGLSFCVARAGRGGAGGPDSCVARAVHQARQSEDSERLEQHGSESRKREGSSSSSAAAAPQQRSSRAEQSSNAEQQYRAAEQQSLPLQSCTSAAQTRLPRLRWAARPIPGSCRGQSCQRARRGRPPAPVQRAVHARRPPHPAG